MTNGQSVPRWLEEKNPDEAATKRSRRWSTSGFISKTLHDFADLIRDEVFSEYTANNAGLLQRLDPRVKVLTLLLLVGTAGLLHHIFPLIFFNLWILGLAKLSRVPMDMLIKRVWSVVFVFTGVVVFPALFNVVQPGDPLVVLYRFQHSVSLGIWTLPAEIAITRQGLTTALLLMLRVGASVSLAALLTLTTQWHTLLKALGVLRISTVFLAVLEMTYRYIFLLLQTSSEMFMARRSRMVGHASTREKRGFVTSAMGQLWTKTHAMGEEVHDAMLSRGYSGAPRSLAHVQMKLSDWIWLIMVFAVAMLFVGGDRIFG